MTNAYLDLARRCEEASGPDRNLDADIMRAIGESGLKADYNPFRYTASIDAAVSLVPEGWEPLIDGVNGNGDRNAAWIVELYHKAQPIKTGAGKTAALALCAASLRAKGAGE